MVVCDAKEDDPDSVECEWVDNNGLPHRECFRPAVLKPYEPKKVIRSVRTIR